MLALLALQLIAFLKLWPCPSAKCYDVLENFVGDDGETYKYEQRLVRQKSSGQCCQHAASSCVSVPAMQQEVANRTRKLLEIELDDVLAVSAAKCCSFASCRDCAQPDPLGRSLARLTTVPWLSLDVAGS